jgi:Fe-S oxidoreductase
MRTAVRVLLLALLLGWGWHALPAAAAQTGEGWTSSNRPVFDFRENGSALPMYGLFVPCLLVFLYGVYRHVRGLRIEAGESAGRSRAAPRGLFRLVQFGLLQRRLLRRRYSAWSHLPLSLGFLVLALGSLTIMVDSYALQPLGIVLSRGTAYKLFQLTLEIFGLALIVGVGVWVRPPHMKPGGYALPLLVVLLAMGLSGFVLEGLRIRLEASAEPWSFAGSAAAALVGLAAPSAETGLRLYEILWWSHAVVAFGLIAAVPYTPLRHTLISPSQILVGSDRLSGKLTTPFRLAELMRSGQFDVKVGANRVEDFSWRERLSLAACTDAGSCQDACPAYATGTALSPVKLMDDLEQKLSNGSGDLVDGTPSEDAIWSCTLCGACTQACPVLVDPMSFVVQLRRGLVAQNRLGKQRTDLLSNLSYSGNPYGSNGSAREELAPALGVPTLKEQPRADVLYWIGCASTFDARARETANAMVAILKRAGVSCAVLGPEEACCGDPARRTGEEGLFQDRVAKNLALFERYGVKKIVTHCAHCFNTFRNEYPEFGGRFEVEHHTSRIHSLIESGKIRPGAAGPGAVTLHDSCYLGRFHGGFTRPREILRSLPGARPSEMPQSGREAFCCGAGGANYWYEVPRTEKMSTARVRDAEGTGARVLVTECPFCLKMLEDAAASSDRAEPIQVRDIAEVVADSLGGSRDDA